MTREIEAFVSAGKPSRCPILFWPPSCSPTSSGRPSGARELGDDRWREVVRRHHAIVRRELARFGGQELDTAGDGFFAIFDGPARAIRCAGAIVGASGGRPRRAGGPAHGECELDDGKVAGIAVNTGARVVADAGPGEVLVSSTVRTSWPARGSSSRIAASPRSRASPASGGMPSGEPVAVPDVSYTRSGDVSIAYQVVGDGPTDLVFLPFLSNLYTLWQAPKFAEFGYRLAEGRRLIVVNARGVGLSDRPRGFTIESRMDDLRAVMDAVGSERPALLGIAEAAATCAVFAASNPDRVERLVLYDPWSQSVFDARARPAAREDSGSARCLGQPRAPGAIRGGSQPAMGDDPDTWTGSSGITG